jgi:hypothetical protein
LGLHAKEPGAQLAVRQPKFPPHRCLEVCPTVEGRALVMLPPSGP